MGFPPIISLLTATFPIFRIGRFPADDFPAAETVLADAVSNDAAKDFFTNCRRVRLFDIIIFLTITLSSPKHPSRSTGRITYRLSVKHVLFGPKLELFGRVALVAVVEVSGKALRGGIQIDVLSDQTRGNIII